MRPPPSPPPTPARCRAGADAAGIFGAGANRLFGYGIGVHLIHGQPVRRAAEIDPRADHLSFQCNSMADVEDRLKHWGIKYVKEIILEGPAKVQQVRTRAGGRPSRARGLTAPPCVPARSSSSTTPTTT